MNFTKRFDLAGRHAFLSPSQYAWIRYDEDKLVDRWNTSVRARLGSELHEYASTAIRLKRKQPRTKETVNSYINDVIGYRMESEQVLYYSDNCFGTADAIKFSTDKKTGVHLLQVFDLKTGDTPAKVDQLLVYCALFFLEYGFKMGLTPFDITYDLRIYQSDEIIPYDVDPKDVVQIVDKIKTFDRIINERKAEEA